MGKKKREHITFDQTLKSKKSIPFSFVNKQNHTRNLHMTQIKLGRNKLKQYFKGGTKYEQY